MITDGRWSGNLSAELTSFIGRRREVSAVKRLLGFSRLVTLTGASGVGKSRLAMRVALDRQRAYEHGAWLVQLADVDTPDLVAPAAAEALGLAEQADRRPTDLVIDHVRDRQLLIVLDNCEHVAEACAELVDALLRGSARLTVLVTSQRSLGVAGEHVWPVEPLAVPTPGEPLPASALRQYPALELFADRAAAVRPGFAITADNEQDVVRICYSLDGIPLAIELAVIWLRTLSVAEVVDLLDDRFRFLVMGSWGTSPRHHTLLAAVQWSYAMCSPAEGTLWRQVSIFADDFDLAGARAVVGGDDVLIRIDALVDKSVLRRIESLGAVRYRLLFTLREYGLEQLREAGEERAMRRAHRDHYLTFAERLGAEWFGPKQLEWLHRLRAEQNNLRAALEHSLIEPDQRRTGMRIAAELWFHWTLNGHLREGRDWLERASAADPGPSRERVRVLAVAGWIAGMQGDLGGAESTLNEALVVAGQVGDEIGAARAAAGLAVTAFLSKDFEGLNGRLEDTLARYAALSEPDSIEPMARIHHALIAAHVLDAEQAIELCQACHDESQARGELWVRSLALQGLAKATCRLGRLDAAVEHACEALRIRWQLGENPAITATMEVLVWIMAAAGQWDRAATLLGAVDNAYTMFNRLERGAPWERGATYDARIDRLRSHLGAAEFSAAFQRGNQLTIEEAVAHANGEEVDDDAGTPHTVQETGQHVLTRRERQIAQLVAEGLSNRDIAARLVISQRTAESHVEHILAKLQLSSRTQVAVWVKTARGD